MKDLIIKLLKAKKLLHSYIYLKQRLYTGLIFLKIIIQKDFKHIYIQMILIIFQKKRKHLRN
jgi:hypothetical protein